MVGKTGGIKVSGRSVSRVSGLEGPTKRTLT